MTERETEGQTDGSETGAGETLYMRLSCPCLGSVRLVEPVRFITAQGEKLAQFFPFADEDKPPEQRYARSG